MPFHEARLTGASPMLLHVQTAGVAAGKAMHVHPEGQLYVATRGLIAVETAAGRIVMPPGRMGWIPPAMPHGARVLGSAAMAADERVGYSMYLVPALCEALPPQPVVLALGDMIPAMLERMSRWPAQQPLTPAQRRLLDVLLDEVRGAAPEPFRLAMPAEPRLARMASAIVDDPADETPLDAWSERLGMSRRTITRRFRAETGLSVVEWRQLARLQRAFELLDAGESVTSVSLTLGYDSVSSFIALFRRFVGTTPARFAARDAAPAIG